MINGCFAKQSVVYKTGTEEREWLYEAELEWLACKHREKQRGRMVNKGTINR